jgi:hypothetical protein
MVTTLYKVDETANYDEEGKDAVYSTRNKFQNLQVLQCYFWEWQTFSAYEESCYDGIMMQSVFILHRMY